jgi:hypothetical protein
MILVVRIFKKILYKDNCMLELLKTNLVFDEMSNH